MNEETTNAIESAIDADIPILLWGEPGTGKTATLLQMAAERKAHVEVLIGSQIDPVDVGGQPVPTAAGHLHLEPPPWARRMAAALKDGQPAWLVLDELSTAPANVLAALLRVVQERMVAGVDLRGCRIVAAANPADTAADGGLLDPATANRWLHVEWKVNVPRWIAGEIAGWGQPSEKTWSEARTLVTAYVQRRSDHLILLPKSQEERGTAWPSPRTWSNVGKFLGSLAKRTNTSAQKALLSPSGQVGVRGLIGPGVTREFTTWASALDLADPEEILAGKAKLPTRADQVAVTLMGVAAAVIADHPHREQRISAAWRLLSQVRPDQAITAAAVIINAWPDVPDEARKLADRIRSASATV